MPIDVKVYDDGYHTCLVWVPSDEKPIKDCRGLTIQRLLRADVSKPIQKGYLRGFVGFSESDEGPQFYILKSIGFISYYQMSIASVVECLIWLSGNKGAFSWQN